MDDSADKEIIGHCESCSLPILGGTSYSIWEDGIKTHSECGIPDAGKIE